MNKSLPIMLILLFEIFSLNAQQVILRGQVYIHNSGYESGTKDYVKDAFVSADFTRPTSTDDQGVFSLVFSSLPAGTEVKVDVEKAGWEIVNKNDLQEVVVGRLSPIRIYLAKRGKIAQARTELYNVSLNAITARHDRLIVQLRKNDAESQKVIDDLSKQLEKTISNRFEAEEILNKLLEVSKQRLPEFSLRLSRVNLDFTSEMYLSAYEHFKAGEIEKAIEAIDEAVLDEEAENAKIKLWQARTDIANLDTAVLANKIQLKEHINGYLLVAKSLQKKAQNQKAVEMLNKAVELLPRITSREIYIKVICYQKAGQMNHESGNLTKAYYYFVRVLQVAEIDMSEEVFFSPLWEKELLLIQNCTQNKNSIK